MPILLINKHTGERIAVQGESSGDFYARAHSGLIPIKWLDGHDGHVVKDSIWATKAISLDEHNKTVEAQKKAAEEQEAAKKQQAIDQVNALQAAAKRKADAEAKGVLEARRLRNRIKRIFQ